MSRQKKPLEAVSGTYSAIPHAVLDSVAFMGASHPAKALLLEIVRQLNGRNNGRLQLSDKWLKVRGWTSKDVTFSAKRVLLERKLLLRPDEVASELPGPISLDALLDFILHRAESIGRKTVSL